MLNKWAFQFVYNSQSFYLLQRTFRMTRGEHLSAKDKTEVSAAGNW